MVFPSPLQGSIRSGSDPAKVEWVTSHTIVTCGPNEFMAPIHNRMPVILGREQTTLWLDPALTEPAGLLAFLTPCPDGWLSSHRVSTLVNNVRSDGPALVEPLDQ